MNAFDKTVQLNPDVLQETFPFLTTAEHITIK